MALLLKGSHSFTCTPRVHPLTEWIIPAFAFPAEAGRPIHLSTPEGWKAELALVAGWLHAEISVRHRELNPDTVAHLSTNRARRRLTSLIEANVLTTTPDHQAIQVYSTSIYQAVEINLAWSISLSIGPRITGRGHPHRWGRHDVFCDQKTLFTSTECQSHGSPSLVYRLNKAYYSTENVHKPPPEARNNRLQAEKLPWKNITRCPLSWAYYYLRISSKQFCIDANLQKF